MKPYSERVRDRSIWLSATPSPLARTLPFYMTEAGHFYSESDYAVERASHDSFLLLYTIAGCGKIATDSKRFSLSAGQAAVLNCHRYHAYAAQSACWEFFWLHIGGSAVAAMFDVLYPNGECAVTVCDEDRLKRKLLRLIAQGNLSGISDSITISADLHTVFNLLITSALEGEKSIHKREYHTDIESALDYMQQHYAQPITIDDMIQSVHLSKYHFIRLFSRTMGATPYSYLLSFRINTAKTLLRTTEHSIAEIAEACGFCDTSNFIVQFKKRTGQTPTQYRTDFS